MPVGNIIRFANAQEGPRGRIARDTGFMAERRALAQTGLIARRGGANPAAAARATADSVAASRARAARQIAAAMERDQAEENAAVAGMVGDSIGIVGTILGAAAGAAGGGGTGNVIGGLTGDATGAIQQTQQVQGSQALGGSAGGPAAFSQQAQPQVATSFQNLAEAPADQPVTSTPGTLSERPRDLDAAQGLGLQPRVGATARGGFAPPIEEEPVQPISDEAAKEDIANAAAAVDNFLETIDPLSFQYRQGVPGVGGEQRTGVTTQDLSRSQMGRQMVTTDPGTGFQAVDRDAALSSLLAAQARLHDRLRAVEEAAAGGGSPVDVQVGPASVEPLRGGTEVRGSQFTPRGHTPNPSSAFVPRGYARPVTDADLRALMARQPGR